MLLQEVLTELPAEEVIQRARDFFTLRFTPYAGFAEDGGDTWVRFTTEAGDLTLGVAKEGERNRVRGSTSRMHQELSQFLSTLAPPEEVRESLPGPGVSGAG